eukprot:TRINITY_DN109_c0_g1_i1.p1 TRINITY_DN109_c0_g1~~TRINITY_DN109_c0_g1_i1.p1  ORF type:complete len:383 (-),score=77.78 TRINITY_DN109_c0_g1_i1:185-1333(-)
MDEHEVGFFESEKVDAKVSVKDPKPLRVIEFTNFLSRGVKLPEAGSWHVDRKRRILQKYPQVRELFGENPFSAVILLALIFIHYQLAVFSATLDWWGYLAVTYTVGSLVSFQIIVMGHEATHRLITKSAFFSKLLSLIAFLPVFLGPFGIFWAVEHMWHHNVVVDKCMRLGRQSNNFVRKVLFAVFFIHAVNFAFLLGSTLTLVAMVLSFPIFVVPFLLGKRKSPFITETRIPPYNRFPQLLTGWLVANMIASVAFNLGMIYFHNVWVFAYFVLTAGFSNGLHPLGMRNVQEHYHVTPKQPTYSIYGSTLINYLTFFIGHHVEHHDFPTIPWNRLQELRKIAPDFYEKDLFHYDSYTHVLRYFLFDKGVDEKLLMPVDLKTH